jgi:signal transduction histidine kinase
MQAKSLCFCDVPSLWHWPIGLFIVFLALWLSGVSSASAKTCDTPNHISMALRQVTLNGQPIDQATVSIPDKLPNAWWREGIHIRYTLDVGPCSAEQALWLPRVGGPYQLQVQDQAALPIHPVIELATTDANAGRPITLNGRTSMLFRIPPGTQQVAVVLQTLPYLPAGIALAQVGPLEDMLTRQMRSYNEQAGGMTIISIITGLIGLLAMALWRTRQEDRFIFWFGLMCAIWGIRGYFYASDEVTLPPLLFEVINPFTVGLFSIACLQTTLLLLNRSTVRYTRFFFVAATVLLTSFALTLGLGYGAAVVRAATFGFGLSMLFYTTYFIWRERKQLGVWRAGLIVAGFVTLLAASLHDILIIAGVLSPERMSLVLVGFTTLLVAYALVCIHYVIRTLDQAQASNLLLETRVAEKTQALAQSYKKLRTFELVQAQIRERERLLRDLHDGVGAQLMTALRGLERGALDKNGIAHALQDGLDDLRMLMDNADPDATLTDRLAAWRNRWDARLASLGLQLHWHLSDDLDEIELAGDTSLQLLRVVQEACTNIVKHAQASQIWFTALRTHMSAGPTLYIEVRDNGVGLDTAQPTSTSRGQSNMRFRAKQIGAHLTIDPAPPPDQGCCVKLWLPLSA